VSGTDQNAVDTPANSEELEREVFETQGGHMKVADIVALLKEGKQPMVKLTDVLWDDSFGQKGMIARIISMEPHTDDTVKLFFSFKEHKDHNLALQCHNWYIYKDGKDTGKLGTIFEAGKEMDPVEMIEDIFFDDAGDVPVDLTEDNKILAEYLKSGSTLTYVAWLEKQLEDLVPNCMKPWADVEQI